MEYRDACGVVVVRIPLRLTDELARDVVEIGMIDHHARTAENTRIV
jgi:hypothetical protein